MATTVNPLISVQELAEMVAAGNAPALLDVRWRLGGPPGIDSYRAGHIPGAGYVDLESELASPPGPDGRHPLPPAPGFQAAMRAAGVRSGQPVVVYDDADGTSAARAWWLLRFYGHDQVRLLDGGFRAWAEAGQPVGTQDRDPQQGDFVASPGHMPVLDAAAAAELAASGILLDARAPARYRGDAEPVDPVAGHIPGALSAPTAENVTATGRFRPAEQLRNRFTALGIVIRDADETTASKPGAGDTDGQHEAAVALRPPAVGVYCGSGVTAAHEVLALEAAGVAAALYPGSWSGWITDPGRPVAKGPRPG
ncbi:MAG TPA: sulfurtransferase [Streptosporangiaceae bacterium]|nr:sulfurtransferase [Streptosporangiaceae bacterium]